MLSTAACEAQPKDAQTETVKIYGNCDMCKTTIEKAGNRKGVAKVEWNKDTKMATITFNANKTSVAAILKQIALVGYDSNQYLAPDDVYAKLPECCQYDRKAKSPVVMAKAQPGIEQPSNGHERADPGPNPLAANTTTELQPVAVAYFALKDALVNTDGAMAANKALALLQAIKAVQMEKLSTDEHLVWMKVMKDLIFDAEHMSETKDAGHQRDHFITLSKNIYALLKVSKPNTAIYYQFCPMANNGKGANWLSKELEIKNPYFGSQMLSCGKTVETIKPQ